MGKITAEISFENIYFLRQADTLLRNLWKGISQFVNKYIYSMYKENS